MPPVPVRYEPSMETLGEHEADVIRGILETMHRIQTIVAEHMGHAKRGVHAKAHGLLVGELVWWRRCSAARACAMVRTDMKTPTRGTRPG